MNDLNETLMTDAYAVSRWEYHCPAPGCIACGPHEATTLWQLMREVIAHR